MATEISPWSGIISFPRPYLINLNLFHHYEEKNFIFTLSRSVELFRRLACVNKHCAEQLRGAVQIFILVEEISRVRVSNRDGDLTLWFPQIEYQTFSRSAARIPDALHYENHFWMMFSEGQHVCPFESPGWFRRNSQSDDIVRERPQVEVSTALEAWAEKSNNNVLIMPDSVRSLSREEQDAMHANNIEDPHSQSRIIGPTRHRSAKVEKWAIFHTGSAELFNANHDWSTLPYASYVRFATSLEEMEQILEIFERMNRTYPRVKWILFENGILELPNYQLKKFLIFFPRVICIDRLNNVIAEDVNARMIEVFGSLWHR